MSNHSAARPGASDEQSGQTPLHWFIHIGSHKTGSTSIQRYCHRHIEEDSGGLYHYPPNDITRHKGQHTQVSVLLQQGDRETLAAELDRIRTVALERGCPRILLSTESFSELRPPEIAQLRDLLPSFDEVQVIGYFRESRGYVLARIKGILRGKGYGAVRRFLATVEKNYRPATNIAGWEAAFGEENVHVFGYADIGDTLSHLLDFLGVEPEEKIEHRWNVSFDLGSALLAAQLLSVCGTGPARRVQRAHASAFDGCRSTPAIADDILSPVLDALAIDEDHPKLAALGRGAPVFEAESDPVETADYFESLAVFATSLAEICREAGAREERASES